MTATENAIVQYEIAMLHAAITCYRTRIAELEVIVKDYRVCAKCKELEEIIVSSAVVTADGLLFVGMRHDECLMKIYKAYGMGKHFGATQGFVTNKCRFLTRTQAYWFAHGSGQYVEPVSMRNVEIIDTLISEGIWPPKEFLD